jgi:hypothetical protein
MKEAISSSSVLIRGTQQAANRRADAPDEGGNQWLISTHPALIGAQRVLI